MVISKETEDPELNKSYGNSLLEESLLTEASNATLCTDKGNESLSSAVRYESFKSGFQNQSCGADSISESLELDLRRHSLESNLQEIDEKVQKNSLELNLQNIESVQKNSRESKFREGLDELELREEVSLADSLKQAELLETNLHNNNIDRFTKFNAFFETLEQNFYCSLSSDSDNSFAAGVDVCSSEIECDTSLFTNSNTKNILVDKQTSEKICTDDDDDKNKENTSIEEEICRAKIDYENERFNENIDAGENSEHDSECAEERNRDESGNDDGNDDSEAGNDNNDKDEENDDKENSDNTGNDDDDGNDDDNINDPNDNDENDGNQDDVNDESDDDSRTRSNIEVQETEEPEAIAATSQETEDAIEQRKKKVFANFKETACPYCLQIFSDNTSQIPRLLACGHNLCSQCIETIVQEKRVKECPLCMANLNYNELRSAMTNHELLNFMNFIFESQDSHTASIKKSPGALDSVISIATQSEDPKESYFLGPILKMERDLNDKANAIKSFIDMLNNQVSKLENLKIDYTNYAEEFKKSKEHLERAKTIDEIHQRLPNVLEVIKNYKHVQYNRIVEIPEGLVTLSNDLKNFFMDTETIKDVENIKTLMSNTTNQFYFQKDVVIENKLRKIFAKIEYEEPYLLIYSFTDRFPDGYTIFFDFRSMEDQFKKKATGVFMDIAHCAKESGRDPNRIYAKLDENFQIYEEYFSGRDQKTFLDADVEHNFQHIAIKNYLTTDEEIKHHEVLTENYFNTVTKCKPGDIVVVQGSGEMLRIVYNKCLFKNGMACKVGALCDYGIRELSKIKGNCYIKNCGVYMKIDQ